MSPRTDISGELSNVNSSGTWLRVVFFVGDEMMERWMESEAREEAGRNGERKGAAPVCLFQNSWCGRIQSENKTHWRRVRETQSGKMCGVIDFSEAVLCFGTISQLNKKRKLALIKSGVWTVAPEIG